MILIKRFNISYSFGFVRALSVTASKNVKQWRIDRGLPVNKNAEGVLTDGPDYTFLDGRPTPLLHKQKLRMEKHKDLAKKIVTLHSELAFAKERYQNMQKEKQEIRERIINDRLKPKGSNINRKKIVL